MKKIKRPIEQNGLLILVMVILMLIVSGCANVQHQTKFNENFKPPEEISIKITKVSNDTGIVFENDIEKLLLEGFEEKLNEKDLLCQKGNTPTLLLESYITKYREGSAFKRWLLPGWGATELSIRCDLKDRDNNLVGSAVASREIVAGGLYTIGAWKTVFKDVTDDVASDLREQLNAKGYITKPRQENLVIAGHKLNVNQDSESGLKESSKSNLALSLPLTSKNEIKIDENEPWTGTWQIRWFRGDSYTMVLKQDGKEVKATDKSCCDFMGAIISGQLRGWVELDSKRRDFEIEISKDKMSFNGIIFGGPIYTRDISGKRKE